MYKCELCFSNTISRETIPYIDNTNAKVRKYSDSLTHLSVRLFVCLSPKCVHENAFFSKLNNLQQWSPVITYRKSYVGFSKNPLLDHEI